MPDRLDPTILRTHIEALRVAYPDISQDEEQWLLTLESETDLREFLTRVVRRMIEAETFAEANDQYIRDAYVQRDKFKLREATMRLLAFRLLQAAELKKLELAPATLSIRAGVPKVIVTDETVLPENCVRIFREPNRTAIKEHLARGEPVPGAELSNAEPSLAVIRRRAK